MQLQDSVDGPLELVTLGPEGTCHERAVRAYMAFQGIEAFEIEFIADFLDGLERVRGQRRAFLIQCSAHPRVHEVTERYWRRRLHPQSLSRSGSTSRRSERP